MLEFEIDAAEVDARINAAMAKLENTRPLFERIARSLETETDLNFESQGRPHWAPHKTSTLAKRLKRNNGSSVLQILKDSGILAGSISSDYGDDFALIGAGGDARDYAAIHQFGGTIERAPQSRRIRLRTDAKGDLVRQGKEGSAKGRAAFARENQNPHKRFRESWATVDAYKIKIPARPYLPFTGSGPSARLQPEAERSVLDAIQRMLSDALG